MAITEKQIAEWRELRGKGMVSAIGEYTPDEFWEALDEIERLRAALESPERGVRAAVQIYPSLEKVTQNA